MLQDRSLERAEKIAVDTGPWSWCSHVSEGGPHRFVLHKATGDMTTTIIQWGIAEADDHDGQAAIYEELMSAGRMLDQGPETIRMLVGEVRKLKEQESRRDAKAIREAEIAAAAEWLNAQGWETTGPHYDVASKSGNSWGSVDAHELPREAREVGWDGVF